MHKDYYYHYSVIFNLKNKPGYQRPQKLLLIIVKLYVTIHHSGMTYRSHAYTVHLWDLLDVSLMQWLYACKGIDISGNQIESTSLE